VALDCPSRGVVKFLSVAIDLVALWVAGDAAPLRPADDERDCVRALSRVVPRGVYRFEAPDLDKFRLPLPVLGDRPFELECLYLHLLGERMCLQLLFFQ
jgi:hypothetical protein